MAPEQFVCCLQIELQVPTAYMVAAGGCQEPHDGAKHSTITLLQQQGHR